LGSGATGGASGLSALEKAASKETTGTVTDIVGRTLYVTNSSGSLVAVRVSSSTTVDRNASTTLTGLKPGDTVTVQGTKEKNGSVEATSISDTEKGVTSTGLGGGGAFP
jgi:flagellar hook assembly protein FlgD